MVISCICTTNMIVRIYLSPIWKIQFIVYINKKKFIIINYNSPGGSMAKAFVWRSKKSGSIPFRGKTQNKNISNILNINKKKVIFFFILWNFNY